MTTTNQGESEMNAADPYRANLRAKITSIIGGMKVGETKRFRSGAEVHRNHYNHFGYDVVSPDGDTSASGISKDRAIDLVLDGYR
jgi:hypothetical protein